MAIQAPVELGHFAEDASVGATHSFTVPSGGVPLGALLIIRSLAGISSSQSGVVISSIADNRSNFYSKDVELTTTWPMGLAIISCIVSTALQVGDVIDISLSNADGLAATFSYFTCDEGWVSLDQAASQDQGPGTNWDSTSVSTAFPQEVLIGAGGATDNAPTSTPGGAWTEEDDFNNAMQFGLIGSLTSIYQIVTNTTGDSANGTWSVAPNGDLLSAIATYQTGAPKSGVHRAFNPLPFL